jgi:hypothetical protein
MPVVNNPTINSPSPHHRVVPLSSFSLDPIPEFTPSFMAALAVVVL